MMTLVQQYKFALQKADTVFLQLHWAGFGFFSAIKIKWLQWIENAVQCCSKKRRAVPLELNTLPSTDVKINRQRAG